MQQLIAKIKNCESIPQLDTMRLELVKAGKENPDSFGRLQSEFIKKKNQLERIPLRDRTW